MNVKQLLELVGYINPETDVVINFQSNTVGIERIEYDSVLHRVEITTTDPVDYNFND